MSNQNSGIIISTLLVTIFIVFLAGMFLTAFLLYLKSKIDYRKDLIKIKSDHEKDILCVQLEMQEKTFQNISRELHDNIGLTLTLTKLKLNTLDFSNLLKSSELINSSIELITKAIYDLSDVSRSLNSYFVKEQGFISALNEEISKLKSLNIFDVSLTITGEPAFIDSHKEVVLFRIIQEALNNTIKHSGATAVKISLNYCSSFLDLIVTDNGRGLPENYPESNSSSKKTSGIANIKNRVTLLNGTCSINSKPKHGTSIYVRAPF